MNKHDIFSLCKRIGLKKKKSRTIANHTQTIFEKEGNQLIIDSSSYSDNVWDANLITKGASNIHISSLSMIESYFNKL